jgi:aryl-alcohol dehydrogenase-like predicted oxidoreductase
MLIISAALKHQHFQSFLRNSFAAQPPLMPEPTTMASKLFCALALVLRLVESAGHEPFIVYSPLQRGLLTSKIKPGHVFTEGDTRDGNRFFSGENIKRVNMFLDELKPLAADKNASISQLVIAWTIKQPGITLALVGARNAEQAVQNAKASEVVLSDEELTLINEKISRLQLVF